MSIRSFFSGLEVRQVRSWDLLQILLLGDLLIINKRGIVQLNSYLVDGVIIWVSSMAIIMAVALLRRPFTTAKVVDIRCPQFDQRCKRTN